MLLKLLYFCLLKWPGDCFCIQGVGYQGPNCTDCKPLSGYIVFVHKCTYQTSYTPPPRPRHANNFTLFKLLINLVFKSQQGMVALLMNAKTLLKLALGTSHYAKLYLLVKYSPLKKNIPQKILY